MKSTLPTLLAVAVLAGLLHNPEPAFGQSNELKAIQTLQRDFYDLVRKIDELKTGQGERAAQTETLIKQLMDANATLTAELKTLQESVRKNQTDQQTKVIEPMSAVKIGMEDVSRDVSVLQTGLNSMNTRQAKTETTLTDLKTAVSIILKQTENVPQATPVSAAPSAADAAALLFASAQRDKLAGKANFALQTFFDLSQKFPDSPEAPMAVYEMGSMYAANGEYEQALKAFDRVLEQFPDNPMRKDAQFHKAEQLASLGRRAEAVKEYNAFAKQYPGDDKAQEAIGRAAAPAPAKPKVKGKGK